MSEGSSGDADLVAKLTEHFQNNPKENNGDAILNCASIAAAKGWHLKKMYLIGLLKGLLLLKNNAYAPEAEFNKLIESEIKRLYLRKPIALGRAFVEIFTQPKLKPMSCSKLFR
jgi:hypothetical protein